MARPWGIDLAAIEVPVLLWHGVRDRNVPVACGRYLAQAIPGRQATFYPGDAHLSVPVNHGVDIFAALAGYCPTRDRRVVTEESAKRFDGSECRVREHLD